MEQEKKTIELRSDAVNEIIGKAPSWLVRRGTLAVSLIILLLVIGSVVIRYPDLLEAKITIISAEPPVEMVARQSGLLERLYVKDSQYVEEGTVLGIIESSVNPEFVFQIEPALDSIPAWLQADSIEALTRFVQEIRLQPGQLKDPFSLLQTSITGYLNYHQLNKHRSRLELLQEEQRSTRIHYDRIYEQRVIREEDLKLSSRQLERNKTLLDSGTISEVEYEASEQDHLARKLLFEETRSGLSSYQIELDKLGQRIRELQLESEEERMDYLAGIYEKLTSLSGAISEWYQQYVFKAPVSGLVSFNQFDSENQQVMEGQSVLVLIRDDDQYISGKMMLPIRGAGKSEVGQTVLVKLDQFPYMEYGELTGLVDRISLVPQEGHFMVDVSFPTGLLTSYDKRLVLTQGMTGTAEIITESMSFMVRIVNPIRYLIRRNKEVRSSASSAE